MGTLSDLINLALFNQLPTANSHLLVAIDRALLFTDN